MQNPLRTGLLAGCGLLIAVVVVNASLSLRQLNELHDDASWVLQSQEVLTSLERAIGLLKDAETGQRGYIITGNQAYLEPYNSSLKMVSQAIDDFGRLTIDNVSHQSQVPRLKELADKRILTLDRVLKIRNEQGRDAAVKEMLKGDGKAAMDALRMLVGQLQEDERQLLIDRTASNDRAYRNGVWNCALTVLLGLFAVGALLWLLNRYLKAERLAATQIHEQRELLQATLISIGDAVIATDAQGCITFMNYVAETLTGWKTADARGLVLERVFHIVNEETRQTVDNPALRALREGLITGLANHTVLIARDGTEWPIDDSAAPIRDLNGQIIGAILVFREIKERKQRELEIEEKTRALRDAFERKDELMLALQSSEERLRLALSAGRMGVWDWEVSRDHLTWSDQVYTI
ncbi:MAG: CHASE3 domain-containing protein, partial [Planctomycetaceae bacterium]